MRATRDVQHSSTIGERSLRSIVAYRFLSRFVLYVVMGCGLGYGTWGDIFIWDGENGDGDWQVDANWTNSSTATNDDGWPGASDAAMFSVSVSPTLPLKNLPAIVGSVTVDIGSGNTITISEPLVMSQLYLYSGVLDIGAHELSFFRTTGLGGEIAVSNGTITVTGSGGVIETVAVNGRATINGGDTGLAIASPISNDLVISGRVALNGTGIGEIEVRNSGTLTANGAITASKRVDNSGTINGGSSHLEFGDALTSPGTLNIGSSGARVGGPADFSGGTVDFAGTGNAWLFVEGALTLDGGSTLSGLDANDVIQFTGTGRQEVTSGGHAFPPMFVAKSGDQGWVVLQDDLRLIVDGIFEGGRLEVGGNDFEAHIARVAGPVTVADGGEFSVVAGLTLQTGGSITAGGNGRVLADGATFTDSGTVSTANGDVIVGGGGLTWTGAASATVTVGGAGALAITGDFTQSVGANGNVTVGSGGVRVSGTVTNHATLRVTGGNIAVTGASDNAGTIETITSGTQSYTGVMANTGTITGAGAMTFSNALTSPGTLNIGSGGARVEGPANFNNGTVDFAGARNATLFVADAVTLNAGSALSGLDANDVIQFNGTGRQEVRSGGQEFPSIMMTSGGSVVLQDDLRVAEFGSLRLFALRSRLELNGQNLTVGTEIGGLGTFDASVGRPLIKLGGPFAVREFNGGESTVEFNGDFNSSIYHPGSSAGPYSFYNLTMNLDAIGTTLSPAENIVVTNSFTQTRGTFVTGAHTHTIAGDWDSSNAAVALAATGSTIVLTSDDPGITTNGERFNNLTLDRGGTFNSDVEILGNFTAANAGDGTLNLYGGSVGRTVTVGGNVDMSPGANAITALTATASTLELNGATQTFDTAGLTWNNVTIDNRTSVSVNEGVTINEEFNTTGTFTVNGMGWYGIAIHDGGTASNGVTFNNRGRLTLSAGYTFDGGVTATTPYVIDVSGTIYTSTDRMLLTSLMLTGDVMLHTDRSRSGAGADIGFGDSATIEDDPAGGYRQWNLRVAAPGATISFGATSGVDHGRIGGAGGAARINELAIVDADTVIFNGEVYATTLVQNAGATTFNQGVNVAGDVSLDGPAFAINGGLTTSAGGSLTITNAGLLTIADRDGTSDIATPDIDLDGRFVQAGGGNVSIAGDIITTGDSIDFSGAVTLTGNVVLHTDRSRSGSGADIRFGDAATIEDDAAGGYQQWNLRIIGRTVGPGATISFGATSGVDHGRIGGAGGAARIRDLTIYGVDTVIFNGEVYATTLAIVNPSSVATTFNQGVDVAGDVGLNGMAFTINDGLTTSAGGSLAITNAGLLTIADRDGTFDIVTADIDLDGRFVQTGGGSVSIAGDITTTGDSIDFSGAVTLTGDVALDTGSGADIRFGDAATIEDNAANGNGEWNLHVDAPGATIAFGATSGVDHGRIGGTGGAARIRELSIVDADTVIFNGEVYTTTLVQNAGGVATTFNQGVNVALHVDLVGEAFTINSGLTTTGGSLTITNAGLLTIADRDGTDDIANVDIDLDGRFDQNGVGDVSIAGDIATAGDFVDFASAIVVSGNLAIATDNRAPAGKDIVFSSTIDDDAAGDYFLSVDAGTAGAVIFDGAVGGVRALTHVRLRGGSALRRSTAPPDIVDLSAVDLYIDAVGSHVQLLNDLNVGNLYFYSGTLQVEDGVNGRTLTVDGDMAVFGTDYDPHDGERTDAAAGAWDDGIVVVDTIGDGDGIGADLTGGFVTGGGSGAGDNAFFAFPDDPAVAGDSPLSEYSPQDAGYTEQDETYAVGGAGEFGGTVDARFTDLAATVGREARIDVGGNFYVNGADLIGSNQWTLNLDGAIGADPAVGGLGPDRWGSPYGIILNASDVRNTNVTGGGWVNAAEGTTDSGGNSNIQFERPRIAGAYIVNDRVIRVEFNMPVTNANNLISRVLSEELVAYTHANNEATPGGATTRGAVNSFRFDQAFVEDTPGDHTVGEPFDEPAAGTSPVATTMVRELADGDVTDTIYFRIKNETTNTARWKTDATGTGVVPLAERGPNGGLGGRTSTERSGLALDSELPGLDDVPIPDLFFIKGTFFAATGSTMSPSYGYNGAGRYAGALDRAGAILHTIEYGRANANVPATTLYDGHNFFHLFYSEPVDIGSSLGPLEQNIQSETTFSAIDEYGGDIVGTGPGAAEVVGYFSYDDGGSETMARGVRPGTPIVGPSSNALYRDDSENTAFGNNDQELRIYISGYNADTAASERFPGWHYNLPDPNGATVDILANQFITDAAGNPVDHLIDNDAAVPATAATTFSDFSTQFDIEEPDFSTYRLVALPGPTYQVERSEIVTSVNPVTGLINRLEFHVLDNPSIDYSGATADLDDPDDIGFWNPRRLDGTAPPLDPALNHPNTRDNEGLRDNTIVSGSFYGSSAVTDAIRIAQVGIPVANARNDVNVSTVTDVTNSLFGVVATPNDSYFALNIQSSVGSHSWGLHTDVYITYDETLAYTTDLAGNLLRSRLMPVITIELKPPEIELALAIVGTNRIYIKFSEPVFGDEMLETQIDAADFIVGGGAASGLSVIARGESAVSVTEAYLDVPFTISADDIFEIRMRTPDNTSIYDEEKNPLSTAAVRRISDVGLGIIEPVVAVGEVRTGTGGFGSLRTFDGSGFVDVGDITLQARLLTSTYSGLATELIYDVDVEDDVTAGNYWGRKPLPGYLEDSDGGSITNDEARSVQPFDIDGNLRTFIIPGSDPEVRRRGALEFQFEVGGLAAAAVDDINDPLSLRPWGFGIGGIIEQRSGITILNNVIEPENDERTVLMYEIDRPGMVVIQIFALDGSIVRVLHRGRMGRGEYSTTWDGRNNSGAIVARGIYFVRVVAPGVDEYRKVIVAK